MHNPSLTKAEKTSFTNLLTPILLAVIVFISHFWHFRSFGIYEDDWVRIPVMFWPWDKIGKQAIGYLYGWTEGRPLHWILPIAIGGLNAKWGGLQGIYLGGYLIVVINVLLFYYLLKRCVPEVSALAGALTFCLFPADTTRLYPIFFHSHQTSLMFLLLASLCYLTQRRLLSYFLITGSLLTYETVFLPFAAVPLLQLKWDKEGCRQLIWHGLILGVIFASITLFRTHLGEARVTGLFHAPDLWWRLSKNAAAMGIGPVVSIWLTFYRPITGIQGLSLDVGALSVTVLGLCLFLLWREPMPKPTRASLPLSAEKGCQQATGRVGLTASFRQPLKVGLVGLICLSMSYALSFHHFPLGEFAYSGFKSGCIHVTATFGVGLLGAGLVTVLILWAQKYHKKNWAVVGLALLFSLLTTFHVVVQKDFARSWAFVKQFWGNVLTLCPDMTEGTLIIVADEGGMLHIPYISLNSWYHQVIPEKIFCLPEEWEKPPRLFVVEKDWKQKAILKENNIIWGEVTQLDQLMTQWPSLSPWVILPSDNVILLRALPSGLVRVQGSIPLGGREFTLKKPGHSLIQHLDRTPMFDLLIGSLTSPPKTDPHAKLKRCD